MAKDLYGSIQKELLDGKRGASAKYAAIVVGRRGIFRLLGYDLVMFLAGGMPGALGYVLRRLLFPMILKEVGRGVVFGRHMTIRHPHKIRIGRNSVFDDLSVLDAKGEDNEGIRIGENVYVGRGAILSCKEGSIRVGDYCNISAGCTILSETEVVLGKYCFLAGNCYLVAGGNHSYADLSRPIMFQPSVAKGGIRIDEDVWLGAGVIVLDGVTIGRGSIVGAGSVVPASLLEYSLARGARMLKIQDRREPL